MAESDERDNDTSLADAFLQHELMEDAKDYLERGRHFETAAVAQLHEKWLEAFRRCFAERDRAGCRDLRDLATELRLRSLEPPYAAVQAEIEKLKELFHRIGPGDAPSASLDARIDAFFAQRQKPTH